MKLYAFEALEEYLDLNRYPGANSNGFSIMRRDLKTALKTGDITIRTDGIFCSFDGFEHRGYIFNQKPLISKFGLPRFHIAECEIVLNRQDLHGDYIWTNTQQVQLYDRADGNRPYPAQGVLTTLMLCNKCRMLVNEFNNIESTDEFHNYLIKQYDIVDTETLPNTDLYGYTLDWTYISRRYRELRNYICENCSTDLSDVKYRRYLHVHHRNGKKTDNRINNLECLCIRCHSNVDQRHLDNFDRPINLKELQSFVALFPI